MSKIDVGNLLKSMLDAAKGEFAAKWPIIKDYAETEFKKIGEQILLIEKRKSNDEIGEEEAKLLLGMQTNAAKSIMLTIEGIGLLAVEAAINAALQAIKDAVNSAIGIALI